MLCLSFSGCFSQVLLYSLLLYQKCWVSVYIKSKDLRDGGLFVVVGSGGVIVGGLVDSLVDTRVVGRVVGKT